MTLDDKRYIVDLLNGINHNIVSDIEHTYTMQEVLERADNINNPGREWVAKCLLEQELKRNDLFDKLKYIEKLTIKIINLPTTENNNGSI
jgi:hypothetical protein